jgi:hypothetical protein
MIFLTDEALPGVLLHISVLVWSFYALLQRSPNLYVVY